jgi:hypothetical protein
MAKAKKDYMAVIIVGAGGTHARGDDLVETAKRAVRTVREDWGQLYDWPKNHSFKVGMYDVTGHDEVAYGSDGVFVKHDGKTKRIELARVIEVVG